MSRTTKLCVHGNLKPCKQCKAASQKKFWDADKLRRPLEHRFMQIHKNMRRRQLITVRVAELVELWHKQRGQCFYCQTEMYINGGARQANTVSVDRINSSIPYHIENIVLACWACNSGKGEMSAQQYIEHCKRVASRH